MNNWTSRFKMKDLSSFIFPNSAKNQLKKVYAKIPNFCERKKMFSEREWGDFSRKYTSMNSQSI